MARLPMGGLEEIDQTDGINWLKFLSVEMRSRFIIQHYMCPHMGGNVFLCTDSLNYTNCIVKTYFLNYDPRPLVKCFSKHLPLLKEREHPYVSSMLQHIYSVANETFYEIFPVYGHRVLTMGCVLWDYPNLSTHMLFLKMSFYHALSGVSYYHDNNFAHGRITPDSFTIDSELKVLKLNNFLEPRLSSMAYPTYKAPELLLGPNDDPTMACDMWSIGVCYAEAIVGRPIFLDSELEHIYKMCIGDVKSDWPLTRDALDKVISDRDSKEVSMLFMKDMLPKETLFTDEVGRCLDLIASLIRLHPKDRFTVHEALEHEFFGDLNMEDLALPHLVYLSSYLSRKTIEHQPAVEHP